MFLCYLAVQRYNFFVENKIFLCFFVFLHRYINKFKVTMSRKLLTIVAIYLTSVVLMALQKPLFLLWYAEQAAEASSAELLGVSLNGLL